MIQFAKYALTIIITLTMIQCADAQTNDMGLRVHHMTLSVNNLDSMVNWYTKVLDIKLIRKSDDAARIELDGFFIDMLKVKGSKRQPSQNLSEADHMLAQGWRHLVFNVDDFYKTYQLLKAKGVVFPELIDEKSKATVQGAYFKDPEGNILEIRHIMK